MNDDAEQDVRPPNTPWKPIPHKRLESATLSYYFSDSNSHVPIRDVSHKTDPKPDPNVETLTYGLFSHCCKSMRKSIVSKGVPFQFFCTNREGGMRVLTGYYEIGWFVEIDDDDFAIAASHERFVSPGFPLGSLVKYLNGYRIDKWFRDWKYLPHDAAQRLLLLLNVTPDRTPHHVSEIKRLEKWSLDEYGHMYVKRKKGFSWQEAAKLLRLVEMKEDN